jgi:ubiquinone/menaquinone biosynthesis C-methylase UbiE
MAFIGSRVTQYFYSPLPFLIGMVSQGGFDAIASWYDALARCVFGSCIARSQTIFLERILPGSNVLVLGGGTGWWMKEFLNRCTDCKIVYIEASGKMLELARQSFENDKRIEFISGTEESIPRDTAFDVVITFFFLDVFSTEKLPAVVRRLRTALKPYGLWLVADFRNSTYWHEILLFIMYCFFRIVCKLDNQRLPDWDNQLMTSGCMEEEQQLFYGSFIRAAVFRKEGP